MTKTDAYAAMGTACVNAAILLFLSWVPSLLYHAGTPWATAEVAGLSHRLTLAAVALYPFAVGWSIKSRSKGSEPKGIYSDWALRCLLPLLGYALLTRLAVNATAHVTKGAIITYMGACAPLALYGLGLRAPVSPSSGKARSS